MMENSRRLGRGGARRGTGLDAVVNNSLLLLLWNGYRQRVTAAGSWLIFPTVLFGLWGSTSLDHQVHVGFLYLFSLWAVAAICLPFARPRVRVGTSYACRVSAGEVLPIDLEVARAGRRGAGDLYTVLHQPPYGIEEVSGGGVALEWPTDGGAARATLLAKCPRRGVYDLPGVRVCSDFPFGLLCAYAVFPLAQSVVVYPRFSPLESLEIAPGRRYHPGGVALASNLGDSLEFIGSRPFREGDSVRDIDWAATARLDQVIVREYRQEYFHRVAVILDTHVPAGQPMRRDDFERAVSLAASVSDYMARQEYLVDLFAAGPDVYHLTAGRSLAYVDEILEILACVEATSHEPFIDLAPEVDESLAQITTIICLLLDWNEARREFVARIAQDGAAVKVIIIRDAPPTLDPGGDMEWGPIPVIGRADFERGAQQL